MTPSGSGEASSWRYQAFHSHDQLTIGRQRCGGTTMTQLLQLGEVAIRNACLFPNKIGARDLQRSLSFRAWNERSCRLANALLGLGLARGDRVAILAYNRIEWLEIYVALAKAGLVPVPINFRLVDREIRYIVD